MKGSCSVCWCLYSALRIIAEWEKEGLALCLMDRGQLEGGRERRKENLSGVNDYDWREEGRKEGGKKDMCYDSSVKD